MKVVARAVLTVLTAAPAVAQSGVDVVHGDRIYVVDGDTIVIPCAADRCIGLEKIRVVNIDAPEISRPSCEAELVLGLKAKEEMLRLVRGRTVALDRCDRRRCIDPYGRSLAALSTMEDGDLGEALIRAGLAYPWKSGAGAKARRKAGWCGG